MTLAASGWRHAAASSFSFSVDRALFTTLRAGDVISMARTSVGGLGLSILRGDELGAAVGAITSVQLGSDLTVRRPLDLIEQVEVVFRTRDPHYRMRESPIELTAAGETRIVHQGGTLGPYDAFVITAALSTAQLFGTEPMEFTS